VVVTDAAGNQTTQEFVVTIVEDAQLVAEPAAIDFGQVEVGTQARRSVRLLSAAEGAVQVDRVTIAGQRGDVAATLLTDAAGVAVEVLFVPAAVGVVTSAAVVHSNAGEVTITITGEGVEPG